MAGPITISIIGDNRRLDSALASSEGRLSRFGGVASRVGRAAVLGIAAIGVGAVVAGAKLFQMGDDANDANDRIKSVAGTLGIFGDQVDSVSGRLISYAEATARQTGVDTNSIKATQAKLLTFKELARSADTVGGNFDRATKAAIDLAATGFGTAETNASALGKALNDPVKGITALTKQGVTFTDAEKERIATLVESNKMGKAQETVLKAIEGQVGGTAEAMAGGFDRMKITGQQLAAGIGQQLAPQVDRFAAFLLDKGLPAVQRIIPPVRDFAAQAGEQLAPALARVGAFIAAAVPIALQLDRSLLGLVQSVGTNLLPVLVQAGTFLASTFGPVFATVGGIIVNQLIPGVQAVVAFVGGQLLPIVASTAQQVGHNLAPIFTQLAATLQGKVLPAVQVGGDKLQEWWPTIQKVLVITAKLVGGLLIFSSAILGKVLPPLIRLTAFGLGNFIKGIAQMISVTASGIGAVVRFGQSFVDAIQKVQRFTEAVDNKIGQAVKFVQGIPGKITAAFGDAGSLLKTIGGQIIGGLEAGIRAGVDKVMSAVQSIIDKIPKFIRDKLGISSPSKVMKEIAKWIPAGIAAGIAEGSGAISGVMDHIGELIAGAFKKLHDKAIPPKLLNRYLSKFDDEAKRLRGIAKQYTELAGKLQAARDLAASVAGAARDFANLGSVGVGEDGTQTAQSIVQGLQDRLNAIQNFAANIDELRRQGLSQEAVAQIIAEGVEKGSITAQALVAGGPEAIRTVNALQAQIGGAAQHLGNIAAVNMYGTGQQAADGFIAGLEADMEKLDKAASRIARQLVKAIKRELGIKSPSRVARGIARSFTDGLVLQTYVDGSRVKKAGEFTAAALTEGFARPQLTADAVASSGSGAPMPIRLTLEAETMTQLERGRKIKQDLDVFAGHNKTELR